MKFTKVARSRNSRAIRLSQKPQLKGKKAEIFKSEDKLHEVPKNLVRAFELITQLRNDFFAQSRKDSMPQKRGFSKRHTVFEIKK